MVKGLRRFAFRAFMIGMTVCVLASCKKEEKSPPVLPKEEMVRILSEIYITEQKTQLLGLNPDSARTVFQKLKVKAFDKVGVPDSVFKKSYDYYVDHPSDLEWIYTALIDSLQLQEQRAAIPIK